MRALALRGQMFLAPRVIRVIGCFVAAIQPQTGVVSGSGQANHMARVLLYELLEKTHNVSPLVMGREHVSRRRQENWAASCRQPPSSLYREPCTSICQYVTKQCRCPVPSNWRFWCKEDSSNAGSRCNVRGQPATLESMPHLGARGVSRVQPKRRQPACARLHKLSRFQGLEHGRMLQTTNILPKATYDTAVMGMVRRNCELRRLTASESSEEGAVQTLPLWCF